MLTVANFHYIREDFSAPFPSIFGLTPKVFEHQLNELSHIGEFISQATLLNHTDAVLGSEKNYLLITFDDGLQEQYLLAKPILDRLNIPAVYFINSINYIEKEASLVHKIHLLRSQISPAELLQSIADSIPDSNLALTQDEKQKAQFHYNYDDVQSAFLKYLLNFKLTSIQTEVLINNLFPKYFDAQKVVENLYMTDDQLRELSRLNMLGNHTHSHFALGLLSAKNIAAEIAKTKEIIDNFGHPNPHMISYPYGSREACQAPVSDIAMQFGYTVGFTMERGINNNTSDHLLLKRFDCNDVPGGKNETFFKNEYSFIYK